MTANRGTRVGGDLNTRVDARVLRRGPDECWPWLGSLNQGYAHLTARLSGGRTTVRVARFMYERAHGPIPSGLELDHVCHTIDAPCRGGVSCSHRSCVNPAHLEPVTRTENTRRAWRNLGGFNARKTHCPSGHPYDDSNTRVSHGRRYCIECNRISVRARRAALRQGVA